MSFRKKSFNDIYLNLEQEVKKRVPGLTDFEEGSVIRSLLESFAYEQAVIYEQMESVYKSAFVSSANGINLDKVVEVLNITRNEPDYASGSVTFSRDVKYEKDIFIPIGTLITTEEDNKKAYLTTEECFMPANRNSSEVKIQAATRGREMVTERETITVIPKPVEGIKSVINKKDVIFLGRDRESDEELRIRAKKSLLVSGKASKDALETALLAMPEVRDVKVVEEFPEDETDLRAMTDINFGSIKIYIDGINEKNSKKIRDRVGDVRAAGIYPIITAAEPLFIDAVFKIETDESLKDDEKEKAEKNAYSEIDKFILKSRMGKPITMSGLINTILNTKGVTDIEKQVISVLKEGVEDPSKIEKDENGAIKKLISDDHERFMPGNIAVASSEKPLEVTLMNKLDCSESFEALNTNFTASADDFKITLPDDAPEKASENVLTEDSQKFINNYISEFNTKAQGIKKRLHLPFDIAEIEKLNTSIKAESFTVESKISVRKVNSSAFNNLLQINQDNLKSHLETDIKKEFKEIKESLIFDIYKLETAFRNNINLFFENQINVLLKDEIDNNLKIAKLESKETLTDAENAKLSEYKTTRERILSDKTASYNNRQKLLTQCSEICSGWEKEVSDKLLGKVDATEVTTLPDLSKIKKSLKFRIKHLHGNISENSEYAFSFIEKPVLKEVFAYDRLVEPVGQIDLKIASDVKAHYKETVKERVLSNIKEYLDNLEFGQSIEISKLISKIEESADVEEVIKCKLVLKNQDSGKIRNVDNSGVLAIETFEKAVLNNEKINIIL